MMNLLFIFLFIELLAVSFLDFKYKKISNYWIIFNLILAVFVYIFLKEQYSLNLSILLYPFAILAVGFLLFAIGIMGAGDAKYLFSFYLLLPQKIHASFFTFLLVATILGSLVNLAIRSYKNRGIIYTGLMGKDFKLIIKILFGSKMPYAPVIMVSWFFYVLDYFYEIF